MTLSVTVYSSPACLPCRGTKRTLTKAGVPFTEVDISEDGDALRYLRGLGYSETPVVEVTMPDGTRDHWSGFRPDSLTALADIA